VAGVPARTAADLVDLNRRTAIHFYHRLRMIIARQIEDEWAFSGAIEVDESYFGVDVKENAGVEPQVRCPSLAFCNVAARSTHR